MALDGEEWVLHLKWKMCFKLRCRNRTSQRVFGGLEAASVRTYSDDKKKKEKKGEKRKIRPCKQLPELIYQVLDSAKSF